MKIIKSLLVGLFCVCVVSNVYAARPLNTDDAGVVAQKEVEVEVGYEYSDASDYENNLSLVLTTGLLESLDIGIEIPYQNVDRLFLENQKGVGDVTITSKYNFLSDQDLFDAAVSFSYKMDNGNENKSLGTGNKEYSISAIISKAVQDYVFHFNLGSSFIESADDLINYNVAVDCSLTDHINLVAELFGSHDFSGGFDENSLSTLMGITYELGKHAVYDLGITFGLSDAEPDFKVATGFTFVFGQ